MSSHTKRLAVSRKPVKSTNYEKIGFIAAASASFCACASAKSFPNVVKYVLIFGSVPDGRTIACAPPSKSYVNTLAAGRPVSYVF